MTQSQRNRDEAAYFVNHERRRRFPWSLYHRPISSKIASAVREHGRTPTVLIVGCGLEPYVPGVPGAVCFACDIDERAIEACRLHDGSKRLALCPSPYALPAEETFQGPFDVIVAKEVVEHLVEPERWARVLVERLALGGEVLLSTPNYASTSSLGLLERTVLEALARRDGYSRRHIHPSRFDSARLAALDLGPTMTLVGVTTTWNRWTLLGRWIRTS